MSDNGKVPGVYAKWAKVYAAVERIPKNGRNEFHKYDYVTESDLVDVIRPLMAKIGLVLIPSQDERIDDGEITRIHHTFTFVDTADGSSHSFGVWGEGHDKLDKGSYKAFTGAMKYALMKSFLVSTGDDPERDTKQTRAAEEAAETMTASQTRKIENLLEAVGGGGLTDKEWKGVQKVQDSGTIGEAERCIKFLSGKTTRTAAVAAQVVS